MDVLDQGEYLLPAPGVEARRGLVQYQHVGLHGHHARHGHPPLLAAGEFEGGFIEKGPGEAHLGQGFLCPFPALLLGKAQVPGAEHHVPDDGLLEELVFGILKHQAHPASDVPERHALFAQAQAVHDDLAGGGGKQGVQVLDQGGFAAARVAYDAHELPVLYGEGHVLQGRRFKGRPGLVDMGYVLYFDGHRASSISSTVSMPRGRSRPFSRRDWAISAISGTSRPRSFSAWARSNTSRGLPSMAILP